VCVCVCVCEREREREKEREREREREIEREKEREREIHVCACVCFLTFFSTFSDIFLAYNLIKTFLCSFPFFFTYDSPLLPHPSRDQLNKNLTLYKLPFFVLMTDIYGQSVSLNKLKSSIKFWFIYSVIRFIVSVPKLYYFIFRRCKLISHVSY